MVNDKITKLSDGVIKLETTADGVGELEEEIKVKTVEVEAKKAEVDAMIPKLEEEKGKAGIEAAKANKIAEAASKVETEVIALKAEIEAKLAAAEPALVAAAAALESLNVKDLGELKSLKQPPAGVDLVTAARLPRDDARLQAEDRRRPRAQVGLPQHPGAAGQRALHRRDDEAQVERRRRPHRLHHQHQRLQRHQRER